VLIWAALRFGPRLAATAVAVLSAVAVTETIGGLQGASGAEQNAQLLLLQTFLAVTAVTVLVLAAVVAERRRGEARLRELATTDPLTGLANYRRLVAVVEEEMKRFDRTARPFVLLFFDLDYLKGINDRHGHVVESRALCRVAEAIRLSCRVIDTPARYGGDEFVMVLPETDEAEAEGVAVRARLRLAEDPEVPAITMSAGAAVYPRDGDTIDRLFKVADRALYAMKRTRGPD
jgi:diguanylate cyclase (GGDEF)-like protein